MEKNIMNMKRIICEEIEMEHYGERSTDKGIVNQYKITSINGKAVPDEEIILVSLDNNLGALRIVPVTYLSMNTNNYIGKLEIYCCKKKKGLFGKESLKVIKSFIGSFHESGLESGEEKPVSIRELL